MEFRTQVPIKRMRHNQIDYNSRLLLMGSCFADSIGSKLRDYQFQALKNPFGVLFHPLAIEKCLTRAINKTHYQVSDLKYHNSLYLSLEAHSQFNCTDSEQVLLELNKALDITRDQLIDCSHLIVTLGTSWVYRFIETDMIVANCHKIPQKKFLKELLSVEEIQNSLQSIMALVKDVNPTCKFIFTTSPIRHIKDGYSENSRSKAHLIAATHSVINQFKDAFYFPAYELMMDELRDYRFYQRDMVHPSEQAIDYIWDKFRECWLSDEAQKLYKEVQDLLKGMSHRPFNPESTQHQAFLQQLKEKGEVLLQKIPHLKI